MTERTRASWLVYALGALCAGAIVAAVLVVGPASGSQATVTRTATVAQGVVQSTVSGSGNLQAASQLNLGFKTSGTVTHIYVTQGQQVAQGQLLATLDPQSAEVTLEQAKAGAAVGRSQPRQGGRNRRRRLERLRLGATGGATAAATAGARPGPPRGRSTPPRSADAHRAGHNHSHEHDADTRNAHEHDSGSGDTHRADACGHHADEHDTGHDDPCARNRRPPTPGRPPRHPRRRARRRRANAKAKPARAPPQRKLRSARPRAKRTSPPRGRPSRATS